MKMSGKISLLMSFCLMFSLCGCGAKDVDTYGATSAIPPAQLSPPINVTSAPTWNASGTVTKTGVTEWDGTTDYVPPIQYDSKPIIECDWYSPDFQIPEAVTIGDLDEYVKEKGFLTVRLLNTVWAENPYHEVDAAFLCGEDGNFYFKEYGDSYTIEPFEVDKKYSMAELGDFTGVPGFSTLMEILQLPHRETINDRYDFCAIDGRNMITYEQTLGGIEYIVIDHTNTDGSITTWYLGLYYANLLEPCTCGCVEENGSECTMEDCPTHS